MKHIFLIRVNKTKCSTCPSIIELDVIVFKILSLIQYFNMIWGLIKIMITAYFMVMSHLPHISKHSRIV